MHQDQRKFYFLFSSCWKKYLQVKNLKSEVFTRHKNSNPPFMDQRPLFDACPIPTQNFFICLEISIFRYERGLILWIHVKRLGWHFGQREQ